MTVTATKCANAIDGTNVAGTIDVYDITAEVEEPSLWSSPSQPVRGGYTTIVVRGAPEGVFSQWKFVSDFGHGEVIRVADVNTSQWAGTLVDSGGVFVSVESLGRTYNLAGALVVSERQWSQPSAPGHEDDNSNFLTCFDGTDAVDAPPTELGDLGKGCPTYLDSCAGTEISDNGPNHEYKYVASVDTSGSEYNYIVNSDLAHDTAFFRRQVVPWILGADLLHGVRRHEGEGNITKGHYGYWLEEWLRPSNDIHKVCEPRLAGPAENGLAAFNHQQLNLIDSIEFKIESDSWEEPCDARLDDSCQFFLGDVNFTGEPPE